MADTPRPPRGPYCPTCHGTRLPVVRTRRPCPGVRVRYRRCADCGERVKTREVVVTATAGRTGEAA